MQRRKLLKVRTLNNLPAAAEQLLNDASGFRIFAIYGGMGAGKTTFIKEICHHLGAADSVTSPTFTLVNEYMVPGADSICHFDFYRINKITELYDFGFEEYIDSGRYCFIEWPEISEELLPDECVAVWITTEEDESRTIEYTLPGIT
ncbi:MAG: tRNA (adenosine(37)-N6)-threonylcarbamoyltransferase complex ATPase subunit type 1 TsaE [Bacteroidales bacterium]|nr:tRNA (adenosine(37)-N6)-threonylcarbamoyltransferase complex ATPase subunit type 1 TsaE [Bacteroidales bacterium]